MEEFPPAYPDAYPNISDDSGVAPSGDSTDTSPTWQSAVGITIAIVVVVLIVVAHLAGAFPSNH